MQMKEHANPKSWLALIAAGSIILFSASGQVRAIVFSGPHTIVSNFDGAVCVKAADIDGDGDIDVFGAAQGDADITWWENDDPNGNASSWTEHSVDSNFGGASNVYTADIDRDGDLDVVGAGAYEDSIAWWENVSGNGSTWTKHIIVSGFDGPSGVYAADVDGDGDMDVLGASNAAGLAADGISWWRNLDRHGTSWTEQSVDESFIEAVKVCAADVDGDGDIDILGTATVADKINWWENSDPNGNGSSWEVHTVEANLDAYGLQAAEIDGDGNIDILVTDGGGDEIAWWENSDPNGNGLLWDKHTVRDSYNGPRSAFAVDLDQDGDLDIVGSAYLGDEVTWWENSSTNGDGSVWTEHTLDGDYN